MIEVKFVPPHRHVGKEEPRKKEEPKKKEVKKIKEVVPFSALPSSLILP
jgi:hypothetical protein